MAGMGGGPCAPTCRVAQLDPVGSPVAGAGKAAVIHQRLDQQRLGGEPGAMPRTAILVFVAAIAWN